MTTTTATSKPKIIWTLLLPLCLFHFQGSSGRESALFPFGEKNNDTYAHHDQNEYSISLPYAIHFAGNEYKEIHVTPHGYVAFTSSVFQYVHWGKDVPRDDKPFLAPLYFEAFYVGEVSENKDGIYYRMITSESNLLKNMTRMIRESVVGASRFTADRAFITTWNNVRDRVNLELINEKTTNSFQVAVVFNRDETYAIFNYDRVNPIEHSIYYAGINAGFYKGWTNVMPNEESKSHLSRLPFIDSGIQEGRFVFRVTNEKPERGGCNNFQSHLSVSPRLAGMFGGRMLEVSAPCLQSNMSLQCRFRSQGDSQIATKAIIINEMKAKCVVPRLLFRGDITLELSIDGGKTSSAQTSFHIVTPSLMPLEVETANRDRLSVWDQRDARELGIIWDPTLLTWDLNAKVDVNLIGYLETRDTFYYKTLMTLGSNIRNRNGRFSFKPNRRRCSAEDCDFKVGMIEVKLTDYSLANNSLFLTTKILPLGWFVADKFLHTLGRDWPNLKCDEMKNDQEHHPDWLNHLSTCPCTLNQVLADFGRWVPATNCNIFHRSSCRYHESAVHCVRSSESTATASGNQCCYRNDGSLMYSSDTKHGSTPDKASSLGKHPFDRLNHVPELSHWVWDVIPYYYCCLWGTRCNTYMIERPTVNCRNYQLPTTVAIFGDPHIITSYGFGYTMQTVGTFWLLRTTTVYSIPLEIQGQFVKSNLVKVGGRHFSKLNAISLKNSKGDTIEVKMREPYDLNYRLDVLVNGNYIKFNKENGFIHTFQNVAIFDNYRNGRQQNFTIITDRGIGIKIAEEHGTMPIIITIPPIYKDKIGGLLGTWSDSNPSRLYFKNGTTFDLNKDVALQEFINEWQVEAADSLFQHFIPVDLSFTPGNIDKISIPHDFEVICGKGYYSQFCKHDYIVSNNSNVALVSKQTIEIYEALSSNQKHVSNCGQLEVKYGRFDHRNYSYGSTIHVIGCHQGFMLKGHSKYECIKNEGLFSWEPPVDAKCVSRAKEISNIGLIVAIAVGIVVAIFIITVIICCVRHKLKSDRNKLDKVKDPAEMDNMITMKDTRSV